MQNIFKFLTIAILVPYIAACTPSIYLIDRQTVLEMEASGDWHELDAQFHDQEVVSGPVPLKETRERGERRQVLNMTHPDSNATGQTPAPEANKDSPKTETR